MSWQQSAQSAIVDVKGVGNYIVKGLSLLRDNPAAAAFIHSEPMLRGVAERLIGLIPIIGQAENILSLAEFVVDDWDAIAAFGAVLHFHPATSAEMEALRPSFNGI